MSAADTVKNIYQQFVRAGLVDNDIDKAVSLFADKILGIGLGEQGLVTSVDDCIAVFRNCLKESDGRTHSIVFDSIEVLLHTPDFASACGIVHVFCTQDGKTTKSGIMQSLTLIRQQEAWRICALHASPIILSQESIDAYPLKFAENTLARFKADLEKESLTLLSEHFSGGVVAFHMRDGAFVLNFINDSMLDYLGFDRTTFQNTFSDNFAEIIHPADQVRAAEAATHALATGKDYQERLRVCRKDGTSLWMMSRGRPVGNTGDSPILINIFVDISEIMTLQMELQEQAEAIALSEERFRIALEKTSNIIFDCDLLTGRIVLFKTSNRESGAEISINAAQHSLIPGGCIEQEGMNKLMGAFEQIHEGAKQTECEVRVRTDAGAYAWSRISMTGIASADGFPVQVIGLIEDITRQKEAEMAQAREEQYRQAILADSLGMYIINFSKNIFESCKINDPLCAFTPTGSPYDSFIQGDVHRRVLPRHQRLFFETYSRANVLDAHARGKSELIMEYQAVLHDGRLQWLRNTLRILMDAVSGEIKGFMYIENIDAEKCKELDLKRKSERDPLTDVYNKRAAQALIDEKLMLAESRQTGVFLVLDVDHFKHINDTYGHPYGDLVLQRTAQALLNNFRETDIVGRLGGDEFCVFFSGMRSRQQVEETMSRVCSGMRALLFEQPGQPTISCSIGVAQCDGTVKNFALLYSEADQALYAAKEGGRNQFAFFEDLAKKSESPE